MDFWTDLAFTVILKVVADKKQIAKFRSVLAKIYVKIELASSMDQKLFDEIQSQRTKQGSGV